MPEKYRKLILLALLLASVLFVVFNVPEKLSRRWAVDDGSAYASTESLIPETVRRSAVRFDPSYYYEGRRPNQVARAMAEKWESAGINLVFYRMYDPKYGAFYKTDYDLNKQGDFGRFDLLGQVIRECHERGIEVYAWTPVLNHGGAWEAHPEWRAKKRDGSDYTDRGLEFPLCARNPEAAKWYLGFVRDFVENYPELDGVDLAEPVVSWRENEACHCELCRAAFNQAGAEMDSRVRAEPLTRLLLNATVMVHKMEKPVCLTSVQSALPSGALSSWERFMEITGMDLEAMLAAKGDEAIDIICPEFLWQEWKSLFESSAQSSGTFSPEWTGRAVREFMARIDSQVEVLIHLEITDIENIKVDESDLRASIREAVRAGATGIDVYNSHQLDEKSAWAAMSNVNRLEKPQACLVLYDEGEGHSDAIQVGEMLRHFKVSKVDLKPVGQYTTGGMVGYDRVFYVGAVFGAEIPRSLIDDLKKLRTSFCWLGANIDKALADAELSDMLGLEYAGSVEDRYNKVRYKKTLLPKEDPWTHVLTIKDSEKCDVQSVCMGDESKAPYSLRSGRFFWYFADVPPMFAIEGGRFLVFADLLHDIMEENHAEKHLAMVRIEDIHPLTDPASLRSLADLLHGEGVPFQVAVVPVYVYPEVDAYVRMSDRPDFVSALKYMVKKGGTVVMHGYTHQRFAETTADYEFWDPLTDTPPEGQNRAIIVEKLYSGLREFWANDVYPLMWETPHYAGSQLLYSILPEVFSVCMERRQSADRVGTDQYFPYLIRRDRFNQQIVPENLGYVPLSDARAGVITEPASRMMVVRDGVASFFFHAFIDHAVLKEIVRTMKAQGHVFTNASQLAIETRTPFGLVTNSDSQIRVETDVLGGKEVELDFPGIRRHKESIPPRSNGIYEKRARPGKGRLFAMYFIDPFDKSESKGTASKDLKTMANFRGEDCVTPAPVILVRDAASTQGFGNEAAAFVRLFQTIGIQTRKIGIDELENFSEATNLVIVPEEIAPQLSDGQVGMIGTAVRAGEISLITSGFSELSDEIGIEKSETPLNTSKITDTFYPGVEIEWPAAASTFAFESPGKAAFMYSDAATDTPVMIASPLNGGNYIFSSVPLSVMSENPGERFPYFLTHMFRSLNFFPALRQAGFEVYFNPTDRGDEISVEELVKQWRRSGVRVVYATASHVYPEWTYDYERLIDLCHDNAILVYAVFEPPFVHEKFWRENPEWREQNVMGEAFGEERGMTMALSDPYCLRAALHEWRNMLLSHDWDGVLLDRVGWQSTKGPEHPETQAPFHPSARDAFLQQYGFDPRDIFKPDSYHYWKKRPQSLERFEEFRAKLAEATLESILGMIQQLREGDKFYWEVVITHRPFVEDAGIGLDALEKMRERYGFLMQAAPGMERQWDFDASAYDMVQLTIGAGQTSHFMPEAPTAYPTGLSLYAELGKRIKDQQRFTLMSESSLYEVDMGIMPFLHASQSQVAWTPQGMLVEAMNSVELVFSGLESKALTVDNELSGSFYRNRLLATAGTHQVSVPEALDDALKHLKSEARVLDCSSDLLKADVTKQGIDIAWRGKQRAFVILNEKPRQVMIDGKKIDAQADKALRGWRIVLPAGEQEATIQTRGLLSYILVSLSLLLSNAIVLISVVTIAGLVLMILFIKLRRHRA
ncbi:MAG: DUF2334 domain-containing protein [Candidatus Sumerlaeia bacterium]